MAKTTSDFLDWLRGRHNVCQREFLFGCESAFASTISDLVLGGIKDDILKLLHRTYFSEKDAKVLLNKSNSLDFQVVDAFNAFLSAKQEFESSKFLCVDKLENAAKSFASSVGCSAESSFSGQLVEHFESSVQEKIECLKSKASETGFWIVYDLIREWFEPTAWGRLQSATLPVVFYHPRKRKGEVLWLTCFLEPISSPTVAVPRILKFGLTNISDLCDHLQKAWEISGLQSHYRCVWELTNTLNGAHGPPVFDEALSGPSLQAAFLLACWAAAKTVPSESEKNLQNSKNAILIPNHRVLVSCPIDVEKARQHGLIGREIPLKQTGEIEGKQKRITSYKFDTDRRRFFDVAIFCSEVARPQSGDRKNRLLIVSDCKKIGDTFEWVFAAEELRQQHSKRENEKWETHWCQLQDCEGNFLNEDGEKVDRSLSPSSGSLAVANIEDFGARDDLASCNDRVSPADAAMAFDSRHWFIHDQQWKNSTGTEAAQLIPNRTAFLRNCLDEAQRRNIVISGVADIGKTVTAQWIRSRFSQDEFGLVSFFFEAWRCTRELDLANFIPANFVTNLAKKWISDSKRESFLRADVESWMTHLLEVGKICLVLDGLDNCDQIEVGHIWDFLDRLKSTWPSTFVIATARRRFAELNSNLFPASTWQRLSLEPFSKPQQIKFLGWHTDGSNAYDKIPRCCRPIISSPSVLSYLKSTQNAENTNSISEALKAAMESGMGKGFDSSKTGTSSDVKRSPKPGELNHIDDVQIKTGMRLLAVAAFECFRWNLERTSIDCNLFGDVLRSELKSGAESRDLKDRIQANCIRVRKETTVCKTQADFGRDWEGLLSLDSIVLRNSMFNRRELLQISWSCSEVAEYFLAYYFTNLANDHDLEMLTTLIDHNRIHSDRMRFFWTILGDVPSEDRNLKTLSWLVSIGTIVESERLLREGGNRWDIGSQVTVSAAHCLSTVSNRMEPSNRVRALEILASSTDHFSAILGGKLGEEKQKLAKQFVNRSPNTDFGLANFIQLCCNRDEFDDGVLRGSKSEPMRFTLSPFAMQRTCVTNEVFELFSPGHYSQRRFQNSNDLPVVDITLFEAAHFALWLGAVEFDGNYYEFRLPTIYEWEYACRCGEETDFTWHDRCNGNECRYSYCHFNTEFLQSFASRKHVRQPIPVSGNFGDIKVHENPWGFLQMHGNVWEWCLDANGKLGDDGNIRGGSWNSPPKACKSSNPGSTFESLGRRDDIGFRLVMKPVAPLDR